MQKETLIVITEDDEGHASLIKKNLRRSGVTNKIVHYKNGEDTLKFFNKRRETAHLKRDASYLLLLDIKMPRTDGIEVLQIMKKDSILRKVPVIMITTTDNPDEISRCYQLGCSNYISKPVTSENFAENIQRLGAFLQMVEIPQLGDRV